MPQPPPPPPPPPTLQSVSYKLDTLDANLKKALVAARSYPELRTSLLSELGGGELTEEVQSQIRDDLKFWEASKREYKVKENLRAFRRDPDIRNLIHQKGLQSLVSAADVADTASSKLEVVEELQKLPDDHPCAESVRLLYNIGYAYVLMARHFKAARDHVTSVTASKTWTQWFVSVGFDVFVFALETSLAVLSAGVTTFLATNIKMALLDGTKYGFKTKILGHQVGPGKGKVDLYLSEHVLTDDDQGVSTTVSDDGHTAFSQSKHGILGSSKDSGGPLARGLIDGTVSSGVSEAVDKGKAIIASAFTSNPGQMTDPYEFFLEKEVEIRKAAAYIHSTSDVDVLKTLEVELTEKMSIDELKRHPFWGFFAEQHSIKELNQKWGDVSRLLSVSMRRLCWRMYCRSQWQDTVWDFSLDAADKKTVVKEHDPVPADPTEWHYKAWTSDKSWPAHWEKICSDFRGPEHDPENPDTIKTGGVERAWKLFNRNAWISMAAVQCCQIKRSMPGRKSSRWAIDLEKHSHAGGEDRGPVADWPQALTAEVLLWGDPDHNWLDDATDSPIVTDDPLGQFPRTVPAPRPGHFLIVTPEDLRKKKKEASEGGVSVDYYDADIRDLGNVVGKVFRAVKHTDGCYIWEEIATVTKLFTELPAKPTQEEARDRTVVWVNGEVKKGVPRGFQATGTDSGGTWKNKKWLPLYTPPSRTTKDYLQDILASGGELVSISEVRFGNRWATKISWHKVTGKKGRLTGSNQPRDALRIGDGMEACVLIGRTTRWSKKAARVRAYRVVAADDGQYKKHGQAFCERRENCGYCRHATSPSEVEDLYVLEQVRFGWNEAWGKKDPKKNFVNLGRFDEVGLYCILLDPRPELYGSRIYHVSDEWWFRIIKRSGIEIPAPTVAVVPAGRRAITGKVDIAKADVAGIANLDGESDAWQAVDLRMLIRVSVDDQVVAEVTTTVPEDTIQDKNRKFVWQTEPVELAENQSITATATTLPGPGVSVETSAASKAISVGPPPPPVV